MECRADLGYINEESSFEINASPLGVRLRRDRVGIGRGLREFAEGGGT